MVLSVVIVSTVVMPAGTGSSCGRAARGPGPQPPWSHATRPGHPGGAPCVPSDATFSDICDAGFTATLKRLNAAGAFRFVQQFNFFCFVFNFFVSSLVFFLNEDTVRRPRMAHCLPTPASGLQWGPQRGAARSLTLTERGF